MSGEQGATGDGAARARDLRSAAGFTWTLGALAYGQLLIQSYRSGVLAISPRWQAVLALGAVALAVSGALLVFWRRSGSTMRISIGKRSLGRGWSTALIAVTALVFPAVVYGSLGRYLEGLFPRLLLFWIAVAAISVLLRSWFPETPWRQRLLGTVVVYGLFVEALTFAPSVSTYPFSLGWSETSRYYYASLFFGPRVYGIGLSPPELHPTRYLMQSLPFLLGDLPLWTHRAWQVLMWWALPIAAAALLVARNRVPGNWLRWLTAGWAVLFLFQGPVYYHLMVMVIVVLALVDAPHPVRSTVAVIAASIWAGLSRLNWYPVPALLAGCLYLLDRPPENRRGAVALAWPVGWVLLGTMTAFAVQAAYVRFSGIPADRFTSSLSSALLPYRLLPNPTYSPGILLAVLAATAPIGIHLWRTRFTWQKSIDVWRGAYLLAALATLAVGGIVVSLKIGGGSNLHNLDAYLVLLLVIGVALLRQGPGSVFHPLLPPFRDTALLVAVPAVFAVGLGAPWVPRDLDAAQASLSRIGDEVRQAGEEGKRVLFISQRHLLTFDEVPAVPLEADYETVFLMEMAMAENRPYLDRFHRLLADRAFGLIVVDRLSTALQGRGHSFGEENDAWVSEVSWPILCSYDVLARLDSPPVDLLIPKAEPAACPD